MASMKKKRSYEWKDLYTDEYGLKVIAWNATTSRVETVSCRFCIAFGREESINACDDAVEEEKSDNNYIGPPINTNNVDVINEVVDGGGNKRKWRKRTANHKQWTRLKFRTYNFTKHLNNSTQSGGKSTTSSGKVTFKRIRIPVNGDIHNFHVFAVPMFVEHSEEEMFKLLSDSLSALDLDWKMKIVGITTNGATSMTGVRKGIVSRIQAVAAKGLIRVWCGAHQLDLALKKALGRLPEVFLTTLTTMIAYLRRQ
ncbi:unnamed protein product [Sphagnum balticum]